MKFLFILFLATTLFSAVSTDRPLQKNNVLRRIAIGMCGVTSFAIAVHLAAKNGFDMPMKFCSYSYEYATSFFNIRNIGYSLFIFGLGAKFQYSRTRNKLKLGTTIEKYLAQCPSGISIKKDPANNSVTICQLEVENLGKEIDKLKKENAELQKQLSQMSASRATHVTPAERYRNPSSGLFNATMQTVTRLFVAS